MTVTLNSPSKAFRLTGFTFKPGTRAGANAGDGQIHIAANGTGPNRSIRIDHCYFQQLRASKVIWYTGWFEGLTDHCWMVLPGGTPCAWYFWAEKYNNQPNDGNGHGSWADYPRYGTAGFAFFEDNSVFKGTGGVDSIMGARGVFRHNYFEDFIIGDHGTEGGLNRGRRCYEIYNNTFKWNGAHGGMSNRSGNALVHDNTWTGANANTPTVHTKPSQFRQDGGVSGTGPPS